MHERTARSRLGASRAHVHHARCNDLQPVKQPRALRVAAQVYPRSGVGVDRLRLATGVPTSRGGPSPARRAYWSSRETLAGWVVIDMDGTLVTAHSAR